MRRRTIAVAVLVAGLSIATTGAASAGEPGDERGPLVVTCENGELVTREATEEDRERPRAVPVPPDPPRVEEGRFQRVEPRAGDPAPGGTGVRVVPAVPEPPQVTCEVDGPPEAPRIEPARPAPR